jgi:hypothetical protein
MYQHPVPDWLANGHLQTRFREISKIGDRYSLSLNIFDTQNAKSERTVSEFCQSENELLELITQRCKKLLAR